MQANKEFHIRPLDAIGAEVLGINLDTDLDNPTFDKIHNLLLEQEVLLFRNQAIRDEKLVAFARRFGAIQGHPLGKFSPPGYPDILISSNGVKDGQPIGIMDIGQFWHTDGSYLPTPYMFTLLYGLEIPHDANGQPLGDTMFLSATSAYDALSTDLKHKLEGLLAFHSYDFRYQLRLEKNPNVLSAAKAKEDVKHPIVYKHPITGKRAIFVNEGYVTQIESMTKQDAEPLLKQLFAHLEKRQFGYRHKWKSGDLIMWDNISTQHNAIPDYKLPQLRLMKRVTVTSSPRQSASVSSRIHT